MTRASLDDMAAFACVARLRSFARAAAALGTSTSNLSHTIKRLEGRLGYRLLQRNSRSVAPSEAGEALLAALDPALQLIDGALDTLDNGRGSTAGTLRLTATRQGYERVVRPVLSDFSKAHPAAVIEVLIDYGFRDIIADGFDAGIRLGEKIEQDMIALKAGPDLRMAVVATQPYLARHGTPEHPRDLIWHRCIGYRMVAAGSLYAWEFERDGQALQVRTAGPLVFNEPQMMLDAAIEGLGIAYVLEDEAAEPLKNGSLVRVLADWTPPFPGFFLYYPSRHNMRPVLAAFLTMLRQHWAGPATPKP